MAKQLSMEDLIKKYNYIRTNRQSSSSSSTNIETNKKSNEKETGDFSSMRSFFLYKDQ